MSPATDLVYQRCIDPGCSGTTALDDMSFECRAGEIHAVVGENGSGKSTLLGIASGFLAPDEGSVEIAGTRLDGAHAAQALRLGLGMAYQSYAQVLDLSVAENLFLAIPPVSRPPLHEVESWAARTLAEFGLDVQPSARTGTLSLAERQFLEVVKALLAHIHGDAALARVMPPLAAFSPGDTAAVIAGYDQVRAKRVA